MVYGSYKLYLSNGGTLLIAWGGHFIAFPQTQGDFNLTKALKNKRIQSRYKEFGAGRKPIFYSENLRNAHHIHIEGDFDHRILQNFYQFAFFVDPEMQSFYKRFIRDYMRYKDEIQCAGHFLLSLVREDAKKYNTNGDFYAIHARRGDLQFKEVKIGAQDMIENLKYPNGTDIFPKGSLLYIATDDPDGKCKGCMVKRKPCEEYEIPKPVGCPLDTSWDAFRKAGYQVRFMRDYMKPLYKGDDIVGLHDVNPNTYGMLESIVCSKAAKFAGTYFSTFTGYIHRLRGYHGLGEKTYYHTKPYVFKLQEKKNQGTGWNREYRSCWTDDEGQPI